MWLCIFFLNFDPIFESKYLFVKFLCLSCVPLLFHFLLSESQCTSLRIFFLFLDIKSLKQNCFLLPHRWYRYIMHFSLKTVTHGRISLNRGLKRQWEWRTFDQNVMNFKLLKFPSSHPSKNFRKHLHCSLQDWSSFQWERVASWLVEFWWIFWTWISGESFASKR